MVEKVYLYPAPKLIDLGTNTDQDPPVSEEVYLYKVPDAIITTYGYVINKFSVLKGSISFRHRNSVTLLNVFSFLFLKKKIKINNECLTISNGWYSSYYHFTLECLPKLFLLREFIPNSTLVFPKQINAFHQQWFDILKIKNICFITDDQVVKTSLALTTSFSSRDLNHHNIIIPEFSKWVLSHIPDTSIIYPKKIFIGRKNPSHRVLLNRDSVLDMLSAFEFKYIEMETFSVEEQIKIFNNAEQIVCVHGAALTNICFCKRGTKIIDLIHKDFNQLCFLKLSLILGLNYSMLGCEGPESKELPGYRNIHVDTESLKKIVCTW
jgi:hypothetical protein